MNRSRIEWCDHTLNIVTGCRHGCEYCYARQMVKRFSGNVNLHKRQTGKFKMEDGGYVLKEPFLGDDGKLIIYPFGFEPTFHRYRLDMLDKLKMGQNIFVGAMGDLFGNFIPESWIKEVFNVCEAHPRNNYLFLTKNPMRYADIALPKGSNMFYGTSVTIKNDLRRVKLLPNDVNRFISIEPMLEELSLEELWGLESCVDWIIIGAETGNRKEKVTPRKEWIDRIVDMAGMSGIPVFMKDSLIPIMGNDFKRELPEQLQNHEMSKKVKERLVSTCAACGKELRKNQMVTVSVRKKRGGKQRNLCHVCDDCLKRFCAEYGLQSPGLEEEFNG